MQPRNHEEQEGDTKKKKLFFFVFLRDFVSSWSRLCCQPTAGLV